MRFPEFSKRLASILKMRLEKPDTKKAVQTVLETPDEPLPATLTFVLVMGAVFAVLWFLMYALLKARW